MAGRILVIEFDDAASADTLRARIDKATRDGKRYRVIGLFSRPNGPWCTCGSNKVSDRAKGRAKTKWSRKYGFRICTECNRYVGDLGGLKNLVAPDDIISPPIADLQDSRNNKVWKGMFYLGILSLLPRPKG